MPPAAADDTWHEHTFASGGTRNPCKPEESMRRLALISAIAGLFTAPASATAAENVKFCGHVKTWTLAAGANPPKYPQTSCAFARAAYRALKRKVNGAGELGYSFRIRVNGRQLRGSTVPVGGVLIVVMRNWDRYVQITAPY